MSGDAPVNPAEVPVFTGNLQTLEAKVTALSKDGASIATAAGDVHKAFGGLRAYYEAPEAEQLFATTQPVVDKATGLSSDMCVIAGALGTYARDIRPLVARLDQLRADAEAFRARVADDDKWREDGDLIEENLNRRNEIAEVWTQFQAAERAAHAKIVGLVGGKALTVNDGSNGEGMYGYDAEALKQSKSLPWGDAVEESVPWWQVWEHAWDFTKGVVVDGLWGGIKGLGTLVGFDGWEAAGQAWVGLGKLATGLAITLTPPLGVAYWLMPEDKLPGWLRDSRTAVKETGKAMLAWDQWGSNPSRAAGAVTFNVLTTIFTGGAGGAASGVSKAGAAAKVISFAGKAGRALDPATYVFKGASMGVSKIGDVMAGLRGMGKIDIPPLPQNAITLPDGAVKLPDGRTIRLPEGAPVPPGTIEVPSNTVRLPEGTPLPAGAVDLGDNMARLPEGTPPPAGAKPVPEGTVKVPDGAFTLPEGSVRMTDLDGNTFYIDPKGNLYDADGILRQDATSAPKGNAGNPATGADNPRVETPVREPALVGAAARVADNVGDGVIRLGDGLDGLGDVGRVGDDVGGPGGRTGDNRPGGMANNLPTNSLDNNIPGGTRPGTGGLDNNLPGGRADDLGRGPAAGHEPQGGSHDPTSPPGKGPTPPHNDGPTPPNGHADDAVHHDPGPSGRGDDGVRGNGGEHQPETPRADGTPEGMRVEDDTPLPPPGAGDKNLGTLPEHSVRVDEDGLITHVADRPVSAWLDDLSRERGASYREAKEAKAFSRKEAGECVGVVIDLRTGQIFEGINGRSNNVIPPDQLHPTLAERYGTIGDPPPHKDHPLGHAEVKAANQLLWERTKRGLPDGPEALSDLRASVEFPFMKHKETGLPGRPAPFCANCNHMLDGVPSSHGRYTGYPPSDENWIP